MNIRADGPMFFRFRSGVTRCLQSGNQTGRMNDLRGRYPVAIRRARMSGSEIDRTACLRPTWVESGRAVIAHNSPSSFFTARNGDIWVYRVCARLRCATIPFEEGVRT
jgi:hypothetical protein